MLFCFLVSVQFPLYFSIGFSKASMFTALPVVILIIIVSAIAKTNPNLFARTVSFFIHNHYMIWIAGLGTSLAFLAISMLVAIGFYGKHDL